MLGTKQADPDIKVFTLSMTALQPQYHSSHHIPHLPFAPRLAFITSLFPSSNIHIVDGVWGVGLNDPCNSFIFHQGTNTFLHNVFSWELYLRPTYLYDRHQIWAFQNQHQQNMSEWGREFPGIPALLLPYIWERCGFKTLWFRDLQAGLCSFHSFISHEN